MKVLAFNCSPRMEKGNSALILNPFLEGMKEEGAEIELFYSLKLKVNPCLGWLDCFVKTPGVCNFDDDMQMLYPKLRDSDIWVFATPIYLDGITGPMKCLIDRFPPLLLPFFELRDGICRHPLRDGTKTGKVVLISNCGFWELENFDPLLVYMRAFSKMMKRDFAGALLRPHGEALKGLLKKGAPVRDVFEAAQEAGRQLVRDGEMSAETLKVVSRELLPLEEHMQNVNRGFQRALDALEGK
ncbi:MAG: flavodoxin family protein [Chloroflexi bacterium]|nr:flavodoxin family protein [Chloroflexota bacterium]